MPSKGIKMVISFKTIKADFFCEVFSSNNIDFILSNLLNSV